MKIAVCVKEVPDATAHKRIDPGTKRLDRSGEGALNAFDANAVEEALRLKDADRRGRSRGRLDGPRAGAQLAPQGARDGRRPSGARLRRRRRRLRPRRDEPRSSRRRSSASSRTSSSSASSRPTPTAPCSGPPSPSGCAGRVISQVAELTLDGGSLTGKRQTEFGYDVIRAPLPAVVAVADSINEPRYPSLKGIMGAKSKPQETLSLADLGVDGEQRRPGGLAHRGARALRSAAARRHAQDRGRRQRR